MTTTMHVNRVEEYEERGYVIVDTIDYERVVMAHPNLTCLKELRTGEKCLMDDDHPGRCSHVVYTCDVCGHTRRGWPHRSNGHLDWCFMCDRRLIK